MTTFTSQQFGQTVMRDFAARRDGSVLLSKAQERSLAHPRFEDLPVGGRTTAVMTVAFLDLTDFTGRSFWDDPAEVADLAHAVLSGFIETVIAFGGFPLGLRGDGLFAGFGPGTSPNVDGAMALGACAFALNAVHAEVNPLLALKGIEPVQARAGLDHGTITFIRSGNDEHSEVNPLGFAANFAAKCEKRAKSWEIVIGENLAKLLPNENNYSKHEKSPKEYHRDHQRRYYHFYDYRWRRSVPHLQSVIDELQGRPTSSISVR